MPFERRKKKTGGEINRPIARAYIHVPLFFFYRRMQAAFGSNQPYELARIKRTLSFLFLLLLYFPKHHQRRRRGSVRFEIENRVQSYRRDRIIFSQLSRNYRVSCVCTRHSCVLRPLKFRPRNSPFERTKRNGREFKAYLRTQIFETVLSAGL